MISLWIDSSYQLLSSVGKIENILTFTDDELTNNVTEMFPDSIALLIHSSIRSINVSQPTIKHTHILFPQQEIPTYYDISVSRVNVVNAFFKPESKPTYMVVFIPSSKKIDPDKDNLRNIVKTLEARNKALLAANDRLRNRNEELHKANINYHQKLNKIETLNSDMDNLLKSTQIGTIFLDEKKCLRKFTPAVKQQFNLHKSDIGRPLAHFTTNFTSSDYQNILEKQLDEALSLSKNSQEEVTIANQHTYLQCVNPFLDSSGKTRGAVISYIDITRLKQLERHLVTSEARLKAVAEYTKSTISILDLDGRILYINRVAPGVNKEQVEGFIVKKFVPDKMWNQIQGYTAKTIRTKEAYEYQNEFVTSTGHKIYYLNTLSPLITDGEVVAVVIMSSDITELKTAQNQLEVNNQELERKNKELSEFAYIASHDLREPIRTILGFSKMIKRQLKGVKNSYVQQGLTHIIASTQRMEALVNGLLLHSRVGKEEKSDAIDLNELVHSILEDFQKLIEETKAEINFDTLPTVTGYRLGLRMLFQNLIGNALKFRRNHVTPCIKIGLEEEEQYWKFSVSDNGIGIPKKYYDRVFQIFQRLDHSDYKSGSGIGLSLCKKYVELHGGQIWITSEVGKGTTFLFTLKK